jgi:hypothetical protein
MIVCILLATTKYYIYKDIYCMWCGGSFCLPPLFVQKCKKTEKKAEYVAWKPKNINKSKRGKEFFEAKRNFFACQF